MKTVKLKKLFKTSLILFVLILSVSSCGKEIKSDDKSTNKDMIEQKSTAASDAERLCELVINIKLTISEVSNAINEGADDADIEALSTKAKAIDSQIKEIQMRNEGNEEFTRLQQSCYEVMNK